MKTERRRVLGLWFLCGTSILSGLLLLQGVAFPQPGPNDAAQQVSQGRALEILRGMFEYLQAAGQFAVEVEIVEEDVLSSGVKLARHRRMKGHLRRPDKLRGEEISIVDPGQDYWFDGQTFTAYNARENHYSRVAMAGTIDEMIDTLFEEYGFSIPFPELFLSEPYQKMTEKMVIARYLGLDQVGNWRCHQLRLSRTFLIGKYGLRTGTPRSLEN